MDQEKCAAGGYVRGRAEEMTERQQVNQFGKVSRFAVRAEKREGHTILSDVSFTAPYKLMAPFERPTEEFRSCLSALPQALCGATAGIFL